MSPDRARERVSQSEPKNEKIALQAAVYPSLCNGWLLFLMTGYIKRPITFELFKRNFLIL